MIRKIVGYLEWNLDHWEQGYYHQEPEKLAWLEKHKDELPVPYFNLGETISYLHPKNFLEREFVTRRGVVTKIGIYDNLILSLEVMPLHMGHVVAVDESKVIGPAWKEKDKKKDE